MKGRVAIALSAIPLLMFAAAQIEAAPVGAALRQETMPDNGVVHSVMRKGCWCEPSRGKKSDARCWHRCCKSGNRSVCYITCFPSKSRCYAAYLP
jgi:hypothetical protein